MSYYNPKCSACGREYQETDMRVKYYVEIGKTLCQNPDYKRGESDQPGCKDKIQEKAQAWISNQGQQKMEAFL